MKVINEIKAATESRSFGFYVNCMKVNPDKFHLRLSDRNIHQLDSCNEKFSSTCSEKRLGIKSDNNLTFEEQVERLCKKACHKVNALVRSSFMRFQQRKHIVNSFITFHFSCRPLV